MQMDMDTGISDARMAAFFELVDDLHTAVTDGDLEQVTTLPQRELVGWLRDLVYTAQETLTELESRQNRPYHMDW
jgi:succinylglutamate desuccinylase